MTDAEGKPMKQIYNASTSWKKASIKKPIHPWRFFSKLKWLDGSPLKILPYRQKIFSDLLYKFDDDESLYYSLALLLRGKKNDNSLDGMLAQLYALCAWKPIGDFTGQIVAFDEESRRGFGLIQEARQSQPGAA